MFLNKQPQDETAYYEKMLKILGSLSNLFAKTDTPYLNYRTTENLFCRAFNATNLSRSDIAIDASKDNLGIGIKTFLRKNNNSFEKVAEFNKESRLFKHLEAEKLILKIIELRNERLDLAKRISGTDQLLYHCITRSKNKISLYETGMDFIDLKSIKNIKSSTSGIVFSDNHNEYNFNFSKSTLFKRFHSENDLAEFDVKILEDPLSILENILTEEFVRSSPILGQIEKIYLPLYSSKPNFPKKVEEKSGLNQWNASGRPRDPNEIYIPIPIWIHHSFPNFFPPRDVSFELKLPDGKILSAKVCQDNSKALMSNPNKDLGQWLLRDVLNLKERELLTYEKLLEIGLDSVEIIKEKESIYLINFTRIDSYEKFRLENKKE